MADIMSFPVAGRDGGTLEHVAQQIIDALGPAAGFELGRIARAPSLNPIQRGRLLAIADEIEARQGYGWYFPGDDENDAAS
jgi:hypothetical protein